MYHNHDITVNCNHVTLHEGQKKRPTVYRDHYIHTNSIVLRPYYHQKKRSGVYYLGYVHHAVTFGVDYCSNYMKIYKKNTLNNTNTIL